MTSFKQELKVKVEFEHFLENGTDAYFDTKHMGSTTTWNFHPKCGKVAVTSWEHGGKNSYHVYRLKNNVAADLMLWLKSTDDGLANRIISISFHYEKFEPRAMLEVSDEFDFISFYFFANILLIMQYFLMFNFIVQCSMFTDALFYARPF